MSASSIVRTAGAKTRSRGKHEAILSPVVLLCYADGLPEPVEEYRFHATRKWRFDYCWPAQKVAVEVEGAIWARGRHTRGSGFLKDVEKYNQATADGWRILRTTPNTIHLLRPFLIEVLSS